ncbi:MAG: polyprenyl synthetase family protein [Candidatus Bathyarchaeota archaeon]|nr:MAG: polyprenyl synthetase family protein [Candidatus Bathyarchaeota archaeon]
MERVKALLIKKGQKALEASKQYVLQKKMEYEPLGEALGYFIEDWCDLSHPTLLSLACEAVGGDPETTTQVGAALVLLAGAADVHDDIIDNSITKNSKPTAFGKFGRDIAILLGDALLFNGLYMLHEACEPLPKDQKQAILEITKTAFYKIGNAEAMEVDLRGKLDLHPKEYLDIIKMKVSVAEAATKMGAILGNGKPEEVESLGHYGKALGLLMTIRDEFIDIFELDELRNRFRNECLPLPILYAFQDPSRKKKIIQLLEQEEITKAKLDKILDLVINAGEVRKLGKEMRFLVKEALRNLSIVRENQDLFIQLLESTLIDLPY